MTALFVPAAGDDDSQRPSILFADGVPGDVEQCTEPACFGDLNLDQVVATIVDGKDNYRLAPFFYRPLTGIDEVTYRQDVFRDLERDEVRSAVTAFAESRLVAAYRYRSRDMATEHMDSGHYHRARLFLGAAGQYCDAVTALTTGLAAGPIRSRGLCQLRDFLAGYVSSEVFETLQAQADDLLTRLDAVRYCVVVKGDRVTVGPYSDEADYSKQVAASFDRFQQSVASDGEKIRPNSQEEDFAQLSLLSLVAKLYPDVFADLDTFCHEHAGYLDDTVAQADREFQFYLRYLDYLAPLRAAGLTLSYPQLSGDSKQEQALDTFDLALAAQLTSEGDRVVCNDVSLSGPERILVISGPNNGDKTTLARAFGQLHHLARLGCPVPGRDVELFLCDRIYTHFEREEDVATLAGKLQDELNRLRADLAQATPSSVVVLNEVFNSTAATDALFLSRQILGCIRQLDALAVCVTFLDELSTLNEKTVSMVSQVDPADPAVRTHRVTRTPADGRAYARAIAEKYELTFEQVTAERSGR